MSNPNYRTICICDGCLREELIVNHQAPPNGWFEIKITQYPAKWSWNVVVCNECLLDLQKGKKLDEVIVMGNKLIYWLGYTIWRIWYS